MSATGLSERLAEVLGLLGARVAVGVLDRIASGQGIDADVRLVDLIGSTYLTELARTVADEQAAQTLRRG